MVNTGATPCGEGPVQRAGRRAAQGACMPSCPATARSLSLSLSPSLSPPHPSHLRHLGPLCLQLCRARGELQPSRQRGRGVGRLVQAAVQV